MATGLSPTKPTNAHLQSEPLPAKGGLLQQVGIPPGESGAVPCRKTLHKNLRPRSTGRPIADGPRQQRFTESINSEVPEDRPWTHAKRRGDFGHRQSPLAKLVCSTWPHIGRASASSEVDAAPLGQSDPSRLSLPAMLKLDLRKAEQDTRNHSPNGAAQIDQLCHRHDSDPSLAPIGQHVDTVKLVSREAVELPDDDGLHSPAENSVLQFVEGRPRQGLAGFLVLEPDDVARADFAATKPASDLCPLAVVLLAR